MPEPTPRPTPGPQDLARFRAAEDQLYPLAMTDPERYQRGVRLCGLLLDDLRSSCPDTAAVLERRPALLEQLADRAARAGLDLLGLDPGVLVDSACAVRCRELVEQARSDERARIAAAREAGRQWLAEEPDPSAVLAGFYRKVEVHVPTETRLISSMEADGAGRVTYRLEVVPGVAAEQRGLQPRSCSFQDRDDWLRAVDRQRSEIAAVS
jgi:hypothetical protein